MGRKKKYTTPEEKREAARAAQRRYYESHQAAEQAKARERWSTRGSAQRRARRFSEARQYPDSITNYHDDSGSAHSPDRGDSNSGSFGSPSTSAHLLSSSRRSPSPESEHSSRIDDTIHRLFHLLRRGGEMANENELLEEQARQFIAAARGLQTIPSWYASVCAARLATTSRVVREACAVENEVLRQDPNETSSVLLRVRSLIKSATRHEAFDEELGIFMRMEGGLKEYERAFEAQELLWQQQAHGS